MPEPAPSHRPWRVRSDVDRAVFVSRRTSGSIDGPLRAGPMSVQGSRWVTDQVRAPRIGRQVMRVRAMVRERILVRPASRAGRLRNRMSAAA
jgi:hypothetical protein